MLRFNCKRILILILVILSLLVCTFKLFFHPESDRVNEDLPIVSPSQYIVNSPKCKILNLNPFDTSILKYIHKTKRTKCSVFPLLTTVSYNPFTETQLLEVNRSAIPYYSNSSNIKCCVKWVAEDFLTIIFGPCKVFHDPIVFGEISQFVLVFCVDHEEKLIYENMHAGIVKVKKHNSGKKTNPNQLNVLLLGFDSMSRMNFYRTMPKTASHLHTHGWTEMRGYNKIADNTLPNMMAFLTGLPPEHFSRAQSLDLDHMPYIWKEFSRAGFVTAYAEDQPLVSTFHCHLKGFRYLPTDHYLRDYIYAGELMLMDKEGTSGCIAHKSGSEHVMDFMLDFVSVYRNDSFFGLFWVNQISHNNLNRASGEDDHVLEVLRRLEESGAMNTTMVVLLSDHGLRVGEFRRTNHGWYEDRLPLLFISIPEWYKNQNPQHYLNLLTNSERLTSPYDLYLTMKQVLYGNKSSVAAGCRSCHSLFAEVPASRSCPEAGVSPHWCTCHPPTDVDVSDDYRALLSDRVVAAVNKRLISDPDIDPGYVCEQLKTRSILYIREKNKPGLKEVIVGVATEPGGAEFEATVVIHPYRWSVKSSISRLNSYGNESSCALNPVSKLFCFCKLVTSNPGYDYQFLQEPSEYNVLKKNESA